VWGGTNDILGGADAATTYTRAETLCDNLRAGGFDKIIFVNCLPRTDFTAGQETIRGEFNTLLAADHSFADVLVDAASGDFTGEFIDGVHLNATGNQHLVDSFMTTALTSVL
jgi:lysophospholipase L1-like esterase